MREDETTSARELCLIVRVGRLLYALPIACVAETMRPQPVRPVTGGPPFVRGLTSIRGGAVPVLDAASVLAEGQTNPLPQSARFVSLKTAGRVVALAVDEVVGVRQIAAAVLSDLPPLLATAKADIISAIGIVDGDLLMVLRSGKLVSDDVWAAMDALARS